MLLIYLDNEVTENQDLNMDLLDVHNDLFSPLRRTRHERVSNAVLRVWALDSGLLGFKF